MRPSLPGLLLVVLVLASTAWHACGKAGGTRSSPDLRTVAERHDWAVARYQRLTEHHSEPGGHPVATCAEVCALGHEVCSTADQLCADLIAATAPGARCKDALRACSWARTLLPRTCGPCFGPVPD